MTRATIVIPQRGNGRLTCGLVDRLELAEPDIDIIIINDGSDSTSAIRRKYPSENIRVLHNYEDGLTVAWNYGVAASDSDIVVLVNNDVKCLGVFIDLCKPRSENEIVGAKKHLEPLYKKQKILQGWFLCFNKSLWTKLNGFDERFKLYFQDTDFQIRALKEGGSLRQVDLPLRHLGHKTAHNKKLCPDRGKIFAADKAEFKEKYGL